MFPALLFFTKTPFTYFCCSKNPPSPKRYADKMVVIAQLVRASDCGSEGRRFEPG